jgi:hypothetical protein
MGPHMPGMVEQIYAQRLESIRQEVSLSAQEGGPGICARTAASAVQRASSK